jgi:N-acetyl-gamma-glutamyl-phosphate reductase
MIEAYEAGTAPAFEIYALGLKHKHLPEIMKYTGLTRRPVFIPSVGNFRQGMLVQLPLAPGPAAGAAQGQPTCTTRWPPTTRGSEWVSVEPPTDSGKLDALALNDTNKMELRVFANEELPPGRADRPAGQPGQGRQRRRCPEPAADAGDL